MKKTEFSEMRGISTTYRWKKGGNAAEFPVEFSLFAILQPPQRAQTSFPNCLTMVWLPEAEKFALLNPESAIGMGEGGVFLVDLA